MAGVTPLLVALAGRGRCWLSWHHQNPPGNHSLNLHGAGVRGWFDGSFEVLLRQENGANCSSYRLLILGEANPSMANQIFPKSARFGSRTSGLGTAGSPAAGVWGTAEPWQTPPDLGQRHLSPQFIKKQLMVTPHPGFTVSVSSHRLQGSN